jgi:type I restriction enzyme S subunit
MSVPKLRFPEFLDSGEWEEKTLGDLYSFKSTNSFSRDQLNYENGVVRNIHYGDIHTKFSTLFNIKNENVPFVNPSESLEKIKPDCYCVESDIIFADASEDLEDIGKSIEIVHLNNQKLLSGLHTLLARQKNNTFIVGFGGYLFKSNWIRNQIQKESQGTKVLGISATRLSSISIAFPVKTKEQQKIADCLSSIDDRITAETQKLATLKAHKKGLTQQLFPAEGETLPKLRFPEFRDSGEWKKGTIDNLAINTMGNAFKSSDFVENGIQLVRMGNLYQGELQLNRMPVYLPTIFGKEHSNFLVKPLDLLMSMTGTVGKKDYGFIVQVPKKCKPLLLNQRVFTPNA